MIRVIAGALALLSGLVIGYFIGFVLLPEIGAVVVNLFLMNVGG